MKSRDYILIYLNGKRQEVRLPQASMMLADYLREDRLLTGTKIVCAEGDCGACSVLRFFSPPGSQKKNVVYEAINSCITTVAQMDGSSLVTVDALAQEDVHGSPQLSDVQKAMVESNGSQCGFCTPGFVMALTGLAEKACQKKCEIGAQQAKNATTGNLCRCTGYEPIIEAATKVDYEKHEPLKNRFYSKAQAEDLKKTLRVPVLLKSDQFKFLAPTQIKDSTKFLSQEKDSDIFSGGTDLGVQVNKGKIQPKKVLSLHLIPELYQLKSNSQRISVGARVTLEELRKLCEDKIPEFAKYLDIFASPQIKNVATLIGNMANASPIGDTSPFLLVVEAVIHVQGTQGKRKIPIEKFFLGYRKTALKKGEVIVSVDFEIPSRQESFKLYKTSQRKDLDISAVNAAFRLVWDSKNEKIIKARLAMGGVAATPLRLIKTEKSLLGKKRDGINLEILVENLQKEITPLSDLRGSAAFRRVVAEQLMKGFIYEATS